VFKLFLVYTLCQLKDLYSKIDHETITSHLLDQGIPPINKKGHHQSVKITESNLEPSISLPMISKMIQLFPRESKSFMGSIGYGNKKGARNESSVWQNAQ
jgi:hypothetical protein